MSATNAHAPSRAFPYLPAIDGIAGFWLALAIVLAAVVLAVSLWGIVALAMTALALVPVMFIILLMISRV